MLLCLLLVQMESVKHVLVDHITLVEEEKMCETNKRIAAEKDTLGVKELLDRSEKRCVATEEKLVVTEERLTESVKKTAGMKLELTLARNKLLAAESGVTQAKLDASEQVRLAKMVSTGLKEQLDASNTKFIGKENEARELEGKLVEAEASSRRRTKKLRSAEKKMKTYKDLAEKIHQVS